MDLATAGIEKCAGIRLGTDRFEDAFLLPEFKRKSCRASLLDEAATAFREIPRVANLQGAVLFDFGVNAGFLRESFEAPDVIYGEVVEAFIQRGVATPFHVAVCRHGQEHGAISAGGAVATAPSFEQHNTKVRLGLFEIVARREAREIGR